MATLRVMQSQDSKFAKLAGFESLDGDDIELTAQAPVTGDINTIPPGERYFWMANITQFEMFVVNFAPALDNAALSLAISVSVFPVFMLVRWIRLDNSGKNLVFLIDKPCQIVSLYEEDVDINSIEVNFHGPTIEGNQFNVALTVAAGTLRDITSPQGMSSISIGAVELVNAIIQNNQYNRDQNQPNQGLSMIQPIVGPLETPVP